MIDVACVCVGDKFPVDLYIDQLWLGLNKHLTVPFKLTVLTDNPNHDYFVDRPIRTVPIPDWSLVINPWWYKIYLFSPEMNFQNTVLYFDLDVILVKNINKFTTYGNAGFCILQDFNRKWIKDYQVSNSSVMKWEPKSFYGVWEEFSTDKTHYIKKFRGDQDYITNYFKGRKNLVWWPKEWAMSFKWEIYKGGLIKSSTGLSPEGTWPADDSNYQDPDSPWLINSDCSVVVFHGKPNPWETEFGIQHKC
jgi:hypothetical protein